MSPAAAAEIIAPDDPSDDRLPPFFAFSAGNAGRSVGGEQTLTFLFTDIEQSGLLWRNFSAAMDAAQVWHDDLLRETAQKHHGHVFKNMGDGAFLVFQNANDALHAAVDAQIALHNHFGENGSAPLPLPLRVRMAVHTGAAQTRNGDFFGLTLSQTTRLLGAIHGGQIVLTQSAAALTRQSLPDGITLRELGQHQLRDFDRPEPLFQAGGNGFPCPEQPLRTGSLAPPHNLPRQRSSFIGREKEIVSIKRLLSASPLVTITGAGGGGKTRLAIQVAELLLPDFESGAFFVDLSPLTDGARIAQAVAQAVCIEEKADKTTEEAVTTHLRPRSLLLVLDNCEHLVEACALFVDGLLRACPDLRILTTSRESLGLWGETVWPVPTLGLPPVGGRPVSLQKLQAFEAVRLFCDRAQAQNPHFHLSRPDAPHILRLCRLLDGLPLALEIAASWTGVLTPAQLVERLSDGGKLLKAGGDRVAQPRQKTLRAVIDWSYNLLEAGEQALFRRLSVFAGGWTPEAAEGVCADPESDTLSDDDVIDGLRLLAKKSLIVVDYQASSNTGSGSSETQIRYRMLETLRQYGQERLLKAGEADEARERHQAYFATFAETAEPHLRGADQKAWLDKLEADHDNFRAALVLPGVSAAPLRITVGLCWFWYVRGYVSEGRSWLDKALAQNVGDELLRARAERAAGVLAQTGDVEAATTYYANALVVFERQGRLSEAASVQANLGSCYSRQNQPEKAEEILTRSLRYYAAQNDASRQSMVLLNLASVAMNQNRNETAEIALTEALDIFSQKGDQHSASVCLHNLGRVRRLRGNLKLSVGNLRESLRISIEIGEQGLPILTLLEMALVACDLQQYTYAASLLAKVNQLQNNGQTERSPLRPEDAQEQEKATHLIQTHLPITTFNKIHEEVVLLPLSYFVGNHAVPNTP